MSASNGTRTPLPGGTPGLGLLGGTFDPVHLGHLRAAEEVRRLFALAWVEFLPAGTPPHKTDRPTTEVSHRLAMLQEALRGQPHFRLSEAEACRHGLSYLVDTLKEYRRHCPAPSPLFFIMGMDSFREIATWHNFPELFSLSHFVVLSRPGYPRPELAEAVGPELAGRFTAYAGPPDYLEHPSGHRVYFQETLFLEISSSQVRSLIRQGRDASHLVPAGVLAYIREKNLYR